MILINPILTVLSLACLGIDIVVLFLLVRLVQPWRAFSWLAPFDKAGKSLVDSITTTAGNLWSSKLGKELSCRGRILVCLGMLTLAKLIITALVKCFV